MIPVDQEFTHNFDIGQHGDCFRACIASVLEVPRSEVPHFAQEAKGDAATFWNSAMDWLEARGWEYVHVPSETDARLLSPHFISGPSPRGNGVVHMVIGLNGAIAHDPHPARTGLAGSKDSWRYSCLMKI